MTSKEHPIVFISYAKTNPKHSQDIVNFANTLRRHGIDAKLDEFDLKVGHDLYYFMEKIESEADFVLLISNKEFAQKANDRQGGVGTETQIMSNDVYGDVEQEKVIPIVWECDEHGEPYLPTFVKNRYYIDFSSEEKRTENYELLLRTIYNKPKNPKKELGEMPKWIEDTNKYFSSIDSIINQFEYQVENHPERFNYLIEEFLNEYFESLKTFEIEFRGTDVKSISKEIFDNLDDYELLKNDLVIFLDKMFKVGKYQEIDSQLIIEFLTKIFSLNQPKIGKSYNNYSFSNFNFILIEIFLYFIAFGLKYKNYVLIGDLFYSPYYLEDSNKSRDIQYFVNLDKWSSYTDEILKEYFKIEKNRNYVTALGMLLYERVPTNLREELLVDADLLCCYISYMDYSKFNGRWFPYTHIYKQRGMFFDLFRRLTSKKFFESAKPVFDVETIEEFKTKVISTRNSSLGMGEIYFTPIRGKVNPIEKYIDLDKLCSER